MKTINNAQKTENRNRKNTTAKTFAVVASLVLISFTVSANGFRNPIVANNASEETTALHNTTSLAAFPLFAQSAGEVSSDAYLFETAKDADLPVESWMTSNKYFGTNTLNNELNPEKNLEIERWMIDSPYFTNPAVETESEPALQIENWMTTETLWKASK